MTERNEDLEVKIRPATKDDMSAVAEMIKELADFEKMPSGPKLTVKDLQRDGFETSPAAFHCFVAECRLSEARGGWLVGYALYFPVYSTWRGRSMQLEDLCVRRALRRRGVGGKLFQAVAKEAVASGCSRLDFHVLEWNKARNFYEARGAVNLTAAESWCYYRLDGEALQKIGSCESKTSS